MSESVKIASFNINGIKARLPALLAWLEAEAPDVVVLQEIKSMDANFPSEPIEDLGYNVVTHGQKSFNGVAMLSKYRLEDVERGLPGDDEDEQARWIEATIATPNPIRLAGLYLPNGNPVPGPKFDYKLAWMERLHSHAANLLAQELPVILAGDYNVIPQAEDAAKPEAWAEDALFLPESRAAFHRLLNIGYTDAIRACHPSGPRFTFWDYQARSWERDNGIRIDHLLLSPEAADRMIEAGIDKDRRGMEKPSDHVPVWVQLRA